MDQLEFLMNDKNIHKVANFDYLKESESVDFFTRDNFDTLDPVR